MPNRPWKRAILPTSEMELRHFYEMERVDRRLSVKHTAPTWQPAPHVGYHFAGLPSFGVPSLN